MEYRSKKLIALFIIAVFISTAAGLEINTVNRSTVFPRFMFSFLLTKYVFLNKLLGSQDERKLLYNLLLQYNVLERPVGKHENAINVGIGVSLMQILNVVSLKVILLWTGLWISTELLSLPRILLLIPRIQRRKQCKLICG